MLSCEEDYRGDDLGSDYTFDLSQCIDLCMSRGIECMGVTFASDFQLCRLKQKMMSNGNSGGELQSAIRIGRPGSASPSTQLLVNGDFATELPPWELSIDAMYLSSLVWENSAA